LDAFSNGGAPQKKQAEGDKNNLPIYLDKHQLRVGYFCPPSNDISKLVLYFYNFQKKFLKLKNFQHNKQYK
jgi:hypothetical protein